MPKALSRNRQTGSFNLYDIRWMLHPGENTVAVHLLPSDAASPLNWAPQFALDARADGAALSTSDPGWGCRVRQPDGSPGETVAAVSGGPSEVWKLPKKNFRGCMFDGGAKLRAWLTISCPVVLLALCGVGWLWRRRNALLSPALHGPARQEAARQFLASAAAVLLVPVTVLLAALLVEATWAERDEILWFRQGRIWAFVLPLALLMMDVAVFSVFSTGAGRRTVWRTSLAPGRRLDRGSSGHDGVEILLIALLAACALLRAYRLDFQPLDDDEYASVQACIAIAEHGVPRFTPEVFYTRSPLYHYLTGAVVLFCGENLWALRLPSVAFGVATGWLIYVFGAQILRNRWLGFGAAVLFTIHPYTRLSSHIARFYQQQQFFALLTIYCFSGGWVTGQDMRWRYAMLASMLAAVLSQELSLLLAAPLAVGYVLFAEKKSWADEARFFIVAGCVLALIGIDIVVFQTVCLTRTEGISPNIEPTLKPYFFYPTNFFTMFIAYSRLHLGLSVLLALGFPLAMRERSRAVAALYFTLFGGVAFCVLFITTASLRYQYWLLPVWILLGLYGVKAILETVARLSRPADGQRRHGWLTPLLAPTLFTAVVLSFSPWRIAGSYDCKLLPDSTGAFRYVNSQLREGDVVAATATAPARGAHRGGAGGLRPEHSAADGFRLFEGRAFARPQRVRRGDQHVEPTPGGVRDPPAAVGGHHREKFRSRGA